MSLVPVFNDPEDKQVLKNTISNSKTNVTVQIDSTTKKQKNGLFPKNRREKYQSKRTLSSHECRIHPKCRIVHEFDYTSTTSKESVPLSTSKYLVGTVRDYYLPPDSELLSKEALYRIREKYGTYGSPDSVHSLGIPDIRTSVGKAAIKAGQNPIIIERYTRKKVSSDATNAAKYLITSDLVTSSTVSTNTFTNKKSTMKSQNNYSLESAKAVLAQSSVPLIDEGIEPEVPVAKVMDLSKVLTKAEYIAYDRIDARCNAKQYERILPIKPYNKEEYATTAAHIVSVPDSRINQEIRKDTIHYLQLQRQRDDIARMMCSPKVLHQAIQRTNNELARIDADNIELQVFGNMEFNKAGVLVAQKHLQQVKKREAEYGEKTTGKVYIGGGRFVSESNINRVAKRFVDPIIKEVDIRAGEQRQRHFEIKERNVKYLKELDQWKELQNIKNANDVALIKETRNRNLHELNNFEKSQNIKYNDMVVSKEKELDELDEKIGRLTARKKNLEQLLEKNLLSDVGTQDSDLENWTHINENDIKAIENQEFYILKPYEDDLARVKMDGRRLNDGLVGSKNEMNRIQSIIEEHKTTLATLQESYKLESETPLIEPSSAKTKSLRSFTRQRRTSELDERNDKLELLIEAGVNEEEFIHGKQLEFNALNDKVNYIEKEKELNSEEYKLKRAKLDLLKSYRKECTSLTADTGLSLSSKEYLNELASGTVDQGGEDDQEQYSHAPSKMGYNRTNFLLGVVGEGEDATASASARSVTGVSGVLDTKASNKFMNIGVVGESSQSPVERTAQHESDSANKSQEEHSFSEFAENFPDSTRTREGDRKSVDTNKRSSGSSYFKEVF